MAFLRTPILAEPAPLVRGPGIVLRQPVMADYPVWAELRAMSREHLTTWEPAWSRDELSRAAFRRRLRLYQREQRDDLTYAFLLFQEHEDELLGGLTFSNVRRGVSQAATLGYWLGRPHVGQGYMTRAVSAALQFAFDDLRLHRIEAACLPHNAASIAVLDRCGFTREGLARRYLKIDGRWQDHVVFGILSDDPRREEGRYQ